MKLNYKIISVFLTIVVVVLLAVVVMLQLRSLAQSVSTPQFISTPSHDKYIEAFMTYLDQLEQEGMMTAKEIRVEESQPFIFILKSQDSQEMTNEDVQAVMDLALRTVSVFESRGGLRHDDIDIAFHRPAEQKIVLIKRRDMPELLSADVYGEMTMVINKGYFTSLINLAGPSKNGRQDYSNAWSVIQALCLAYAGDFEDSDPVCNIISANAASAWVGMEPEQAAEIIDGYGMTELGYLGNQDYRYRFIDFVFEDFIR